MKQQEEHTTSDDTTHQQNGRTRPRRPHASLHTLCTILDQHPFWQGRLWQDVVRNTPMLDESPLSDDHVMAACRWLSVTCKIHLSNTAMMEKCLIATCHQHPRDVLKDELEALPAWDGVSRLDDWLHDVADAKKDAYGMAVSRILPLSMVARALTPGCLYRYVVILEGPEGSGKTSLVRALAGDEWYTELTKGLDNKEVFMQIQGAWVAEMGELDTLTRSEESRLKAFVTAKDDQWVPKYSNLKVRMPRRTVLIGTTNDKSYLKGESGNTRFLPIATGTEIDLEAFATMRAQIFAEALHVYRKDPVGWWKFGEEATSQAVEERLARRVFNPFDQALADWLDNTLTAVEPGSAGYTARIDNPNETTWEEIATKFLHLDTAAWTNTKLAQQVISALTTCGWEPHRDRQSEQWPGKVTRYWRRRSAGGV